MGRRTIRPLPRALTSFIIQASKLNHILQTV